MARIRKTQLEQDKMTDQNIQRVIDLLEPKDSSTKPASKKDCCAILGMSYNTTRLQQVIDTYKARLAREKSMRDAKRGKPVQADEVTLSVSEYLKGTSVSQISKELYRTSEFVKNILEQHSVPIRNHSYDYFKPALIPEAAQRDRFQLDEIVYSARYDSKAKIRGESWSDKHNCWVYKIWLMADRWQQYAYQESFELASLEHIRELGIKL
jgi:hypothetical protein